MEHICGKPSGRYTKFHPTISLVHVPTKSNPADIASRGITHAPQIINNQLWWNGHQFLTSAHQWPDKPIIGEVAIEKRKIKPSVYSVVLSTPQLDHEKFSQLKRLRNTQGYVLIFIRQLRSKSPQQLCITLTELKSAQHQIVKDHHCQYFQEEIQLLREEKQLPRKQVHWTEPLY